MTEPGAIPAQPVEMPLQLPALLLGLLVLLVPLWLPGAAAQEPDTGVETVTFSEEAAAAGLSEGYRDAPADQMFAWTFHFPGVMAGGIATGDLTGNGLDDLYITSAGGPNHLYLNRGDGTFVQATEALGVGGGADTFSTDALFVDTNGNGLLDIFVTNLGPNYLFVNQGDGSFRELARELGVAGEEDEPSWVAAAADYSGDGYLDLFVGNYGDFINYRPAVLDERAGRAPEDLPRRFETQAPGVSHPNRLYRNQGDGSFADVAEAAGLADERIWTLAAAWADATGNGHMDLITVNDFSGRNVLYINRGDGTFEGVWHGEHAEYNPSGMSAEWADLSGSGALDLFVTDIYTEGDPYKPGNVLALNDGQGRFTNVAQQAGVLDGGWGWTAAAFDADLSGQLDIYQANGMITHLDVAPERDQLAAGFTYPASFGEQLQLLWQRWYHQVFRVVLGHETRSTVEITRDILHRQIIDAKTLNYAGHQPSLFFVHAQREPLAYVERAAQAGLDSTWDTRAAAVADFDADGGVDLVVTARQGTLYYRNRVRQERPQHRALQVQLLQEGPNRFAIGARITVQRSDGLSMMREVAAGSGYLSQRSLVETFGLGDQPGAEVTVRWPDGTMEHIGELAADQRVLVRRDEGVAASHSLGRGPGWNATAQDPGVYAPLLAGEER